MDDEDELCLRIGRIARAHVAIDVALRRLYVTLASPSFAVYLANNNPSTNALVEDCRLMIVKADVSPEFRDAAFGALAAAKAANEVRNRTIHDMWLAADVESAGVEPKTWRTFRNQRGQLGAYAGDPPRDLTFLDEALTTMRRTGLRVQALSWALWELLPFYRGSQGPVPDDEGHERDSAGQLAVWTAMIEDRFDLLDNGGFRPHTA
jgi:hypothetical protein